MTEYKDRLQKILGFSKINDNTIPYYHTKYPEWNKEYYLKPMFDDIKKFDYSGPVIRLHYPEDVINLSKSIDGKTIFVNLNDIKDVNNMNISMIDQIFLEYTKCRQMNKMITFWFELNNDNVINYLNSIGEIYYIKKIALSQKALVSLIFQLYSDTSEYKTTGDILNFIEKTCIVENDKCIITTILFENSKNEYIELVKLGIRNLLNENDISRFYITNSFYKVVEIAEIYMCENSLKFLEMQLLERHINPYFKRSRIFLATIKKWINTEIDLYNKRRILFFSGIILYILGIRGVRDIDIFIDNSMKIDSKLMEIISKYFIEDNTKFYFTDLTMKYSKNWKSYWDEWSIRWANLMGAANFEEIVYNPKFHFYYMGMKFMIFDGDITRRLIRQRPRSMVDLIMINRLLNYDIKIPYIPLTTKKYKKGKDIDKNIPLNDGEVYYELYDEIEYSVKVDMDVFINTMIICFKKNYQEEYTVDEIKKMVGIKKIRIQKSKTLA